MSRLCVNCVHYLNMNGACLLTGKLSTDYVTGKMKSRYNDAKYERGMYGSCGEKGDFFKAETNILVKFANKYPPYIPAVVIFGCLIGVGYTIAH